MVTPAHPPRRTPLHAGLAAALALLVTLGGAVPARAAAPPADFEQLIARADEHASAGRHAEALHEYAQAFEAMPAELKGNDVGQFVALAAGTAAIEDYRARGDRASLEAGKEVLTAFIGHAEGSAELVEEAKLRSQEIDDLLGPGEPTSPEPSARAPERKREREREHEPSPATSDRTTPDRSRLGLALAVSGGVAVLGGVGLMIAGARQVPWYEAKLAAEGWVPTDEGYDQQIGEAERVRNLDFGLGAAVLAVGVGLGVTGVVLVAKRKRAERGVALIPVLGRDRAMLAVTTRF